MDHCLYYILILANPFVKFFHHIKYTRENGFTHQIYIYAVSLCHISAVWCVGVAKTKQKGRASATGFCSWFFVFFVCTINTSFPDWNLTFGLRDQSKAPYYLLPNERSFQSCRFL